MRQELFAQLGSMNQEIAEKDRHKYSLDDLIKLVKQNSKGKKYGK